MSEMADLWRAAFATWPSNFRRKGVLVPVAGEAIPFSDFVMTKSLLVLERPTPDNVGARRVAIPFERIHNLKYTEPLKTEQFLKAGFAKEMSAESLARQPEAVHTTVSALLPKEGVAAAMPTTTPAVQPVADVPAQQHVESQAIALPATQAIPGEPVGQPTSQPDSPQPVAQLDFPQPAATQVDPPQPTPEQIQAAMLERQQSQQQQMQQQLQTPTTQVPR